MSGIIGIKTDNKSGVLGRIYENGSNANGEFVKFEDGTLVCTIESIGSTSNSDVYWTFPHAFLGGSFPTPAGSCKSAKDRICVSSLPNAVSATSWGFSCARTDIHSESSSAQHLSALGRWY